MTARTLFVLALSLLQFAGCSGSDAVPEKEAAKPDAKAVAADQDSRSPEGAATQPKQPTDQPSGNKPQENGMAQAKSDPQGGELAQWLAPYLSDDLATVMAIDLRRLGPAEKALPLIHQFIGRGQEVDLSDVNQVAVVGDISKAMFALLLRTSQPNSELQQTLLQQLQAEFARRSDIDKVAAGFTQGNTAIVGIERVVNQLKRPSGDGKLATLLKSQGDQSVIVYQRVPESVREGARAAAIQDEGNAANTAIHQAMQLLGAITVTVNFEPNVRFKVMLQPQQPGGAAELNQAVERAVRANKERMQHIQTITDQGSDPWLFATVVGKVLNEGQLDQAEGAVTFNWNSTPDFAGQAPQLFAQIGQALAKSTKPEPLADRQAKLKQVGTGLLLHADRFNEHFPRNIISADGKPLMSWRVELLPVMDHHRIYEQLRRDEPWDSPHNAALLKQVNPRLFASNPDTPDGYADIQAVIGPDFGFSPADPERPKGVSIAAFYDGMFFTVMAVEVAPEKAVPWAKPDDYIWDPKKPLEGLGSKDEPYFLTVYGDARVKAISKQESADTLKAAFGRGDLTPYELMPVETP